jgi:hypothetical protein
MFQNKKDAHIPVAQPCCNLLQHSREALLPHASPGHIIHHTHTTKQLGSLPTAQRRNTVSL